MYIAQRQTQKAETESQQRQNRSRQRPRQRVQSEDASPSTFCQETELRSEGICYRKREKKEYQLKSLEITSTKRINKRPSLVFDWRSGEENVQKYEKAQPEEENSKREHESE